MLSRFVEWMSERREGRKGGREGERKEERKRERRERKAFFGHEWLKFGGHRKKHM